MNSYDYDLENNTVNITVLPKVIYRFRIKISIAFSSKREKLTLKFK